jgi:hypothetical protein
MLKDPKWDGPPQPHHPSLDGMIDWMERKNPDMRYEYQNCYKCLCAQYYDQCTTLRFNTMYDAQDELAHYLNIKVAALHTADFLTDGCGYSVRAALKRAYREKQRVAAV